MFLLDNLVREYAWGSHRIIAELTGRPTPTAVPEAELWLGAHPLAPSSIITEHGPVSLLSAIAADPATHLGKTLMREYDSRLPFMFKVLAAEQPLSIQAHPTAGRARSGFAEEDARGVSSTDPERNYRDPFAKPELFIAQSNCDVLCSFRPAEESARTLMSLGIGDLAPYVASLLTGQPRDGLRVVVTTLLSMPEAKQRRLVEQVVIESERLAQRPPTVDGGDPEIYAWAVRLGAAYPGDIGVVISLLLNLVHLTPGEAVYLAPGKLHAYLRGWGIEAMANSDNTLRGGLTPKRIDVPELLRTIDFEPEAAPIVEPVLLGAEAGDDSGETVWPTPAREFAISKRVVDPQTEAVLDCEGPQVLLCLAGSVTIDCGTQSMSIAKGESIYIPAADPVAKIYGDGSIFRVMAGRCARHHRA